MIIGVEEEEIQRRDKQQDWARPRFLYRAMLHPLTLPCPVGANSSLMGGAPWQKPSGAQGP